MLLHLDACYFWVPRRFHLEEIFSSKEPVMFAWPALRVVPAGTACSWGIHTARSPDTVSSARGWFPGCHWEVLPAAALGAPIGIMRNEFSSVWERTSDPSYTYSLMPKIRCNHLFPR